MNSKIFALSMSSFPGIFDRTSGSSTFLDERGFRRTRNSSSTPRRMSSLTDLFSRAAVALSSRYKGSGISTVVRIVLFCHIYGYQERAAKNSIPSANTALAPIPVPAWRPSPDRSRGRGPIPSDTRRVPLPPRPPLLLSCLCPSRL